MLQFFYLIAGLGISISHAEEISCISLPQTWLDARCRQNARESAPYDLEVHGCGTT